MSIYKKPLLNWDLGWGIAQIEEANWIVTFNGHPVKQELTSQRDAEDTASSLEQEMNSYLDEAAYFIERNEA
jgi:hypothetical protein